MDYWDDQLVDLLEFEFSLDFDRSMNLVSLEDNHKSAKNYEEHSDYEEALFARGALAWCNFRPI